MSDEERPLTVSAIIPLYNGEQYLAAAISSIVEQDVPVLEVIVIDDGSSDGSAAEADRLASHYAGRLEIRVLRQENAGQSAARNAAAAVARGDLLAFLDQDDWWHPAHVRRLAAPFRGRPDIGFCYGDFDEIDGAGNWVVRSFLAAHRIEHPRTSIIQWIANDTMVLPTATLVRASAYRAVGGFDPELIGYEDDELWIRLFRAGWKSHYVTRSVSVFRVHGNSSSMRSSFRRSRVIFFRKVAAMLPDAPAMRRYYVSDVLLPRLVRSALGEYLAAIRSRNWAEAREVAATIDELFATTSSRLLRPRERWALRHPRLVRRLLRLRRAVTAPIGSRLTPARRLSDGYHEWND
jgi:glycosyltransferase involved in cell wall biosynthesis